MTLIVIFWQLSITVVNVPLFRELWLLCLEWMGSTEEVADEENNVQASVRRRNANAVPCEHQMAQGRMEE